MSVMEAVLLVAMLIGFVWQGIQLACLEQSVRELEEQVLDLDGDVQQHEEVLRQSRAFRDRHGRFFKTARSRRCAPGDGEA